MTRRPIFALGLTTAVVLLAACSDDTAGPEPPGTPRFSVDAAESPADVIRGHMDATNAALAAAGANYRVAVAEYITVAADGFHEAGAQVIARDLGNQRLPADFVPGDPRRTWSGANGGITFAIDQTADASPPSGLPAAEATAAIQRAMATWDALTCSDLGLTQNDDFGLDIGVVAFQRTSGLDGSPFIFADVQHAGWGALDFPGGTLAVTFTFVFVDPATGIETDVDGNGRADVAFREIYYDPSWPWNINANIDVESVALHEAGHGLSQDHFGNILIMNDGSVKAAPRAVMNALYTGPLQTLLGPDIGGHCGNWANWPNG